MKKCVKKILIMLLAFIVVSETFTSHLGTIRSKATNTVGEQEKLYYGYNVTKGISLSEPDALQTAHPIIDPNSDYASHINYVPGSTKVDSQAYCEESLREIAADFSMGYGSDLFGAIYMVNLDLDQTFDLSKSVDNIYHQQYELCSMYIARHYYVVAGLDVEQIRGYLDEQFKKELYAVNSVEDAKTLFERYGTHLITGYTFGGRMNITNYRTTSESVSTFNQSTSLSNKVSAVVSKVNVGESGSIVEQYGTYENDAVSTSTYKYESFGGEAVSSLTLDGLFTYNASMVDGNNAGFMYTRWVNSINEDKDLAIVGIPNDAQCIPLWELVDTSTESGSIRKYLLNAYLDICGDKYDEFLDKYPDLTRSVYVERKTSGDLPTLNGIYVGTANNMFYYVEASELGSIGAHNEIHTLDTIYLDLTKYTNAGKISYSTQNCETIDAVNGIFKVTGNSGSKVIITVSNEDGSNKEDIIELPIKSCDFEGGSGTEKYPYIIINKNQFKKINSDEKYWTLNADIDFAGAEINSLGNFKGVLDGNYCELKNFKINVNGDEWGLFKTNSGTVENLKISNAGSATSSGAINSIKVKQAGVLCSKNTGFISNCNITNPYINVVYESGAGNDVTLIVGGLVGVNAGKIASCMVHNPEISAYYCGPTNLMDVNLDSIDVYAGGLVGAIIEDTSVSVTPMITSCMVSVESSNSFIYAKAENARNNAPIYVTTKSHSIAFASGIVGYCNTTAGIENTYAYIRSGKAIDDHEAIDADVYYKQFNFAPPEYYAIATGFVVMGAEVKDLSSIKDNYVKCDNLNITKNAVKTSKNTAEPDSSKNEVLITTKNDADYDELKSNCFVLGNGASRVSHILDRNKSTNLQITHKYRDGDLKTAYLVNDVFTPIGYQFEISNPSVGRDQMRDAKAFYLEVYKGNTLITDWHLSDTTEGTYYSIVYPYYKETSISNNKEYLSVGENVICGISVDMSYEDKYTIYYDQIDEYFDGWNQDNVVVSAELVNGDVELIDDSSSYSNGMSLSVTTVKDEIVRGENYVTIKYTNGSDTFSTEYILTVKERNVDSIKIITEPTKNTYLVGETVDLTGIEIEVEFDEGDPIRLSGNKAISELEIIGKTIAEGENSITVGYGGYSKNASFTVIGQGNGSGVTKKSGNRAIVVVIVIIMIAMLVAIVFVCLFRKKLILANGKKYPEVSEAGDNKSDVEKK